MAVLCRFRLFLKSAPVVRKALTVTRTAFSPRYLLYTNLVISGPMSALGDVIQQTYQHSKNDSKRQWDGYRTFTMFVAGLSLTPFCHFWYLRLDKFLPGNSVKIALIKLLPDVMLYSPAYVLLFLCVTSLMERDSFETFKTKVKEKTIGLMSVEVLLWTPAQFFNFYFLPTRYRLLWDNAVSLVADILYSFFTFDYIPRQDHGATEIDADNNCNNHKSNSDNQDMPYSKNTLNVSKISMNYDNAVVIDR